MDVIGHQAECMQPEAGDILAVFQNGHKIMTVSVIFKDDLPVDSTKHDMINI